MKQAVLRNKTNSGEILEAVFLPDDGMNMASFKRDGIEVIDQSTQNIYDERNAGLGAIIGPHFYHRKVIPPIKDESLFPHIAAIRSKGINEPFSHGIGRYAPWKAEATETKISAVLTGKDQWNGVALADLEGQNFKMVFVAEMKSTGLVIDFSIVSDTDSLVGLHYYYYLPEKKGTVSSFVQNYYLDKNERKEISGKWNFRNDHQLEIPLDQDLDFTFFPFPNPTEGKIVLNAESYHLSTTYSCASQENSWQLYHPKNSSFVCIEPISAQDPRHPNLSVSSLQIRLEIFKPGEQV